MNKQKFVDLLRNPSKPENEHLTDLDNIVRDYPYFQSARVLSAKISHALKDKATKRRINSAAVYATDRVLLKKYMMGQLFFIGGKTEIKEVEKKINKPIPQQPRIVVEPEKRETPKEEIRSDVKPAAEIDKPSEPTSKQTGPVEEVPDKAESTQTKPTPTKSVQEDSGEKEEVKKEVLKEQAVEKEVAEKEAIQEESVEKEIAAESTTDISSDSEKYSHHLDDIIVEIHKDMDELRKNKARFDDWVTKYEEEEAVNAAIKKADGEKKTKSRQKALTSPVQTATGKTKPVKSAAKKITEDKTAGKTKVAKAKDSKTASKPRVATAKSKEPGIKTKSTATKKKETTTLTKSKPSSIKSSTLKPVTTPKVSATKKATKAVKSLTKKVETPKGRSKKVAPKKTDTLKKPSASKPQTGKKQASKTTSPKKNIVKSKSAVAESGTKKVAGKPKADKQKEIIDEFIEKKPSISRTKKPETSKKEDLSIKSTRFHVDIASEYLAEIYISQGKSDRAIEIYQNLSLKFPEKKSYFAGLISDLKKK